MRSFASRLTISRTEAAWFTTKSFDNFQRKRSFKAQQYECMESNELGKCVDIYDTVALYIDAKNRAYGCRSSSV